MSRSGAKALRTHARDLERQTISASIKTNGLAQAAEEAFTNYQLERIEAAQAGIKRLTWTLGLPTVDPLITDIGAEFYPDSQRVCVVFDQIILNYAFPTDKHAECLLAIWGTCKCGRPAVTIIETLADLHYVKTRPGKRWLRDYQCSDCKRKQ